MILGQVRGRPGLFYASGGRPVSNRTIISPFILFPACVRAYVYVPLPFLWLPVVCCGVWPFYAASVRDRDYWACGGCVDGGGFGEGGGGAVCAVVVCFAYLGARTVWGCSVGPVARPSLRPSVPPCVPPCPRVLADGKHIELLLDDAYWLASRLDGRLKTQRGVLLPATSVIRLHTYPFPTLHAHMPPQRASQPPSVMGTTGPATAPSAPSTGDVPMTVPCRARICALAKGRHIAGGRHEGFTVLNAEHSGSDDGVGCTSGDQSVDVIIAVPHRGGRLCGSWDATYPPPPPSIAPPGPHPPRQRASSQQLFGGGWVGLGLGSRQRRCPTASVTLPHRLNWGPPSLSGLTAAPTADDPQTPATRW